MKTIITAVLVFLIPRTFAYSQEYSVQNVQEIHAFVKNDYIQLDSENIVEPSIKPITFFNYVGYSYFGHFGNPINKFDINILTFERKFKRFPKLSTGLVFISTANAMENNKDKFIGPKLSYQLPCLGILKTHLGMALGYSHSQNIEIDNGNKGNENGLQLKLFAAVRLQLTKNLQFTVDLSNARHIAHIYPTLGFGFRF